MQEAMPRKTKAELQAEATFHGLLVALVVAVVMTAVVFVLSPGMLVVSGTRDAFGFDLSRGQMWTFSIVVAAAYFGVLGRAIRDWRKAGGVYLQTCLCIVLVMAFAHYGLEASFPGRLLGYFRAEQVEDPQTPGSKSPAPNPARGGP